MGLLGLALVVVAGCAREPKDAVVSIKGWSLDMPGLQQEYERLKGPGTFSAASPQDREAFARTLADKEILLRIAHRTCPKLNYKNHRSYQVLYEKTLQKAFLKFRRDGYSLSEEQLKTDMSLVSREAVVRMMALASASAAPEVHAAQEAGQTFDQIAQRFGIPIVLPGGPAPGGSGLDKAPRWMEDTVRIDGPRLLPGLIIQALLHNLPVGAMSTPFETNRGVLMIQIKEYRPLGAVAEEPAFRDNAAKILENIGYIAYNAAWGDSLKKAAGFNLHPESYGIVATHFATYWDSLNVVVQRPEETLDFQALVPPLWLFGGDEKTQPICELWGKTYTVADFVEGLKDIDLDIWPTSGGPEKIKFQIEGRLQRLLIQTEADKLGFQNRPEFKKLVRRYEEEAWLNQLYDTLAEGKVSVTDTEVRAAYEKDAQQYQTPERISISFLAYPKAKEARAKAVLAKLKAGGPALWFDLAPAEKTADPSVDYMPESSLLEVNKPSPTPALTPFLNVARGMKTGEISDLVPTAQGVGITRVLRREERHVMSFEDAQKQVKLGLLTSKKDALVEEQVERGRKSYGLKVHPERMSGTAS